MKYKGYRPGLTVQEAEYMWTRWRNTNTPLSFKQFYELTIEQQTEVLNLLKEEGD